jgi:teichuronic acid biosynthesis glycosyltransferase TuaC
VKLLVIPAAYPHEGADWIGPQNEHCALALRKMATRVEILAPRPYAPRILGLKARWKSYTTLPREQMRNGIRVHRPAYPVVPRALQAFWPTVGAYVFSRHLARSLHREISFNAILSFDLASTGGLAWRLGRNLGVPTCGWATGGDMRWSATSPIGRGVRQTLSNLDLVFYQSSELKALAAQLLSVSPDVLSADRHVVQSRGVIAPDLPSATSARSPVRANLRLSDDDVLVLYLGRIAREKGVFELVDGFRGWARSREKLVLLLVGAITGHDDGSELQRIIELGPQHDRARIVVHGACTPSQIWDYFTAADIFAFPSFREGMPNSLLEAMAAGLPSVAFAIPAISEITRFGKGLLTIAPYDFSRFGAALIELANNADLRQEIGTAARNIVRKHFSLEHNMRAVFEHIKRLIETRGRK